MGFDRVKIKQICALMLLWAALILALIHSEAVFQGIAIFFAIIQPFIIGGVIAFILNLPMKLVEEKLLKRWKGKTAEKCKRPLSIAAALIIILLVLYLVFITVVPQISGAVKELGQSLPGFIDRGIDRLVDLSKNYPQIQQTVEKLKSLEINWQEVGARILDFLKNGMGDVLSSTVSVAGNLIGGIMNGVISLIFALYVLGQKEKLADQGRRVLSAYLPEKVCRSINRILSLMHRNFSNFITGQCLEAVILGSMFVVTMLLFRMPYAVMIGVLIAFTALIPIVGAFIGCIVGAFLILIKSPLQALGFVILFQVLQQIEGNLIYPRVVGSSVGLPAIWVLAAVSVGGSLFGIAGMLTFIPLVSTFYMLLKENVNARNAQKAAVTKPVQRAAGKRK